MCCIRFLYYAVYAYLFWIEVIVQCVTKRKCCRMQMWVCLNTNFHKQFSKSLWLSVLITNMLSYVHTDYRYTKLCKRLLIDNIKIIHLQYKDLNCGKTELYVLLYKYVSIMNLNIYMYFCIEHWRYLLVGKIHVSAQ